MSVVDDWAMLETNAVAPGQEDGAAHFAACLHAADGSLVVVRDRCNRKMSNLPNVGGDQVEDSSVAARLLEDGIHREVCSTPLPMDWRHSREEVTVPGDKNSHDSNEHHCHRLVSSQRVDG